MIATILPSSKDFHAVEYNERKVRKGVAELIEVKNFGYLQDTGNMSAGDLRDYLIKYSAKNRRIEKAQFHVAFSCKGHEYTPQQLLDIAHQWLDKMGYGEEGQPLLVYAHYDTENTHIHIVTSRVNPEGKKIDHNNERIRSQHILNEIMNIDRHQEMHQAVKDALAYRFETLGQFKAILESSGYETYTDDDRDNLFVKKDGVVIGKITVKELEKYYQKMDKKSNEKRRKQLWSIIMKYRDESKNKDELASELKKKFGISLVFLGRRDNPYGYIIIDHKEKTVYKGNDILSIKKLMQFGAAREKATKESITEYIRQMMEKQPDITTFQMNKLLRSRFRVLIRTGNQSQDHNAKKFGYIRMGKEDLFTLDQEIYERLRYNGRVSWLQSFTPSSWEECEVLANFGHLDDVNKLHVTKEISEEYTNTVKNKFESIMASISDDENVFEELHKAKFTVMRKDGKLYAIDMDAKTILDLDKAGIDVSRLQKHQYDKGVKAGQGIGNSTSQGISRSSSGGKSLGNILRPTDNGHNANREWEVGNGSYDDEEDRNLKR